MITNLKNMTLSEANPIPGANLVTAAQTLHDSYVIKPAVRDVRDLTKIEVLVAKLKKDPARRPVSLREYLLRMQQIPRAAINSGPTNGFTRPGDLNMSLLRLVTGLLSSRMQRNEFKKDMEQPVSLIREMLLLCFEAKPRQVSFSVTGYTASDFIAYIYQDISMLGMGMSAAQMRRPFIENVSSLKEWLRQPPPRSMKNNVRRHIRRRLMVTLDRTNHQSSSLFEDREIPSELLYLIHKLMERDDDVGYTQGQIRDFYDVRTDFNLLAEYCRKLRFTGAEEDPHVFDRVICPSLVEDFPSYRIDLPRGRTFPNKKTRQTKKTLMTERELTEMATATIKTMRTKAQKAVTSPLSVKTPKKVVEPNTPASSDVLDILGGLVD